MYEDGKAVLRSFNDKAEEMKTILEFPGLDKLDLKKEWLDCLLSSLKVDTDKKLKVLLSL